MKKNSNYAYLIFHPEYLVDLLRAGGRFPIRQSFSIPSPDSTLDEIGEFVEKQLPPLSEERYEIWLKFRLPDNPSVSSFSLEDIVSSHFYNKHRQQATYDGVIQVLKVYGIPLLEPLEDQIRHVLEIYDSIVREDVANFIVKSWFPDIQISKDFITQVRLGYKYQQSPSPENLPPIPSELIWAHLVAYNHGLRKFDERPFVLWLQDIQEVFKRNDSGFKQKLKSLGENYNSKFSDILDDAEKRKKDGFESSRWIIENNKKPNSYFSELDKYLSKLGSQQSFFYSALFYLNWRETVLNSDYTGRLSDHMGVSYFLNNNSENPMNKAIAEALFTIIYAGGPRIFQQALIEARRKSLGLLNPKKPEIPKTPRIPKNSSKKPSGTRLFEDLKKTLGGLFGKEYDRLDGLKKKEIQKDLKGIGNNITKIKKGEFDYNQYLAICLLFGIQSEHFDDYPIVAEALAVDSIDKPQLPSVVDESLTDSEVQTSGSEQKDGNERVINESELSAIKKDDLSGDTKKDYISLDNQTDKKLVITPDQTELAAKVDKTINDTEQETSVARKKEANEVLGIVSEDSSANSDDSLSDFKDEQALGAQKLESKEISSRMPDGADELNEKRNEILKPIDKDKVKLGNQSSGNQGKPTLTNKPGTLPINFPE